jgi:hypothetical protein
LLQGFPEVQQQARDESLLRRLQHKRKGCLQSLYRVAHIDFGVQILREFVAGGILGQLFFTYSTSDDMQLEVVLVVRQLPLLDFVQPAGDVQNCPHQFRIVGSTDRRRYERGALHMHCVFESRSIYTFELNFFFMYIKRELGIFA